MAVELRPVSLPSDLAGIKPGSLGPCQLRPIHFPGVGSRDLHHLAADAWEAMALICKVETGYHLTTVGAYRSAAECLSLFYERMTPTWLAIRNAYPKVTRTGPDGKTWYLRRGMALVAGFTNGVPDSNHARGLANDNAIFTNAYDSKLGVWRWQVVGITSVPAVWDWMKANAISFGFSWEGAVEGQRGFEPWHTRYFAGDAIPQRVLDIQAFFAAHSG